MNKLVVITKNQNTYFVKRLIDEVGNAQVSFFNPWLDFKIPEADKYLVRTTGVYGSDLDVLMLESLPKQKLINPLEVLKLFRSKPQQYLWMESENIPLLPWLSLKGSSVLTIEKFFRLYPEVVVKPTIGQGGWGITILNWMQFKSWWKKKQAKKDEQYLIQPFMRGVQELRYFFIKNGPSYVLERQATTGSVANFKRQGVARLASPRTEIINQLEELVEKSGALYGAIDLFFDGKNISILELNSVPGIEQLESSTQINVMGQLLNAKFFCQSI